MSHQCEIPVSFYFLHLIIATFREHQIVTYFEAMEKGKKIVRWPPPIFIPIITIIQFVLFFVNSSMSESLLEKYLQFDT